MKELRFWIVAIAMGGLLLGAAYWLPKAPTPITVVAETPDEAAPRGLIGGEEDHGGYVVFEGGPDLEPLRLFTDAWDETPVKLEGRGSMPLKINGKEYVLEVFGDAVELREGP